MSPTSATFGINWNKEGLLLNLSFITALSFQPTGALMDRSIDMPPIHLEQQHRIKITDNTARAFDILLKSGPGIAYPKDIYVVSSRQLEVLTKNRVGFDIL